MLDTAKRAIVPILALAVAIFALVLSFVSAYWLLLALPALLLAALGVFDWRQTRWTITRNYPVAGRIRWFFYHLRPYLRAYIVEDDLSGTPFSFEARNLVHARARGEIDTRPFGTERNVYDEGYHWLQHSISPSAALDEDPRVLVGNELTSKPYSASVLNVSAMSFGSLSAPAVEALNMAAQRGGFFQDTGEGGISEYHLRHGGDLVWEIGSGYFGARDSNGNFDPARFRDGAAHDQVRMTEIKLSQGAKPGHGGMLPGAKVTAEIARARGVPVGEDCISPRGHTAFATPIAMMEFSAKMRDLSGGKPVGIKLCVGQPHEVFAIMKAIGETGIAPDFIVVDGGEGGTGAAPLEFSDWVGMPLTDGLLLVHDALVGCGLKDRVRLVASGKVHSAMGLARNLAIGADWCNAARAFMFSVGCIQSQRCHLDTCPTGVTTQNKARQRGLVPEVQSERAARFHRRTVSALAELVAAAGLDHPGELRPHHLMHRLGPEDASPENCIHDTLEKGILLEEPEDTRYAAWWKAARADSFRPAT